MLRKVLRKLKQKVNRWSALKQTKIERQWYKRKPKLFVGEGRNISITEFRDEELANTKNSRNTYENEYLEVRKMSYGYPILVEVTAEILKGISRTYAEQTGEKLVVTNMARTREHVEKLKKDGYPVSEESSHMYGEAFDVLMPKNKVSKQTLKEMLKDLQKGGLINYADEGACFHICRNPSTTIEMIEKRFKVPIGATQKMAI